MYKLIALPRTDIAIPVPEETLTTEVNTSKIGPENPAPSTTLSSLPAWLGGISGLLFGGWTLFSTNQNPRINLCGPSTIQGGQTYHYLQNPLHTDTPSGFSPESFSGLMAATGTCAGFLLGKGINYATRSWQTYMLEQRLDHKKSIYRADLRSDKVLALAKKLYITENVQFLRAADIYFDQTKKTPSDINALLECFISSTSQSQVNINAKQRLNLENAARHTDRQLRITSFSYALEKATAEIEKLLSENLGLSLLD